MVTALAREELRRAAPHRPTALTVGIFDGVHRGHQALLQRLKQSADRAGLASLVVTFHPHPLQVLRPDEPRQYLTSLEERLDLLRATGLDAVAPVTFTSALAQTDARDFIALLVDELQMARLVIGPDFALGRQRGGDERTLRQLSGELGYEVEVIDLVRDPTASVSSTEIRSALARGDIERVNQLLGRNFSLRGPVVLGVERGRTIGFPTANLALGADLALPAPGVYATIAQLADRPHPAVTNIGYRPTFDDLPALTVECHLLDFEGDLYGTDLRLELTCRLRGEVKFDGPEALRQQIRRDCDAARKVLAR